MISAMVMLATRVTDPLSANLDTGGAMKPLRVYLDTSVIGGLFDEEFAPDTLALLEAIRAGEVIPVISVEVRAEVQQAPLEVKEFLEELSAFAEVVPSNPEAAELALAYLAAGVVTARYKADALHVALATVAGWTCWCRGISGTSST